MIHLTCDERDWLALAGLRSIRRPSYVRLTRYDAVQASARSDWKLIRITLAKQVQQCLLVHFERHYAIYRRDLWIVSTWWWMMIGHMTDHDVALEAGVGNRIWQVSSGSSTKKTTFLTTKLPFGVEASHCDDLQSLAGSNLAQHRFVTAHVPGHELEPIVNRS